MNPQRCLIYFSETWKVEKEVVDILTSRHERVNLQKPLGPSLNFQEPSYKPKLKLVCRQTYFSTSRAVSLQLKKSVNNGVWSLSHQKQNPKIFVRPLKVIFANFGKNLMKFAAF